MKHRIGFNRLGRKASHRKAMCRNMITSLFEHERISTTKAKALEVRRMAEKMITRAKVDSVHNRRIIAKDINDKKIVAKLFTAIGPRFVERPGGYTRILKTGLRNGDAAEMVLLELVEKAEEKKSAAKKKTKAKRAVVEEKEVVVAEETKDEEVKAEKPKAKPKAKPATKTAAKKSSTTKKDDKSEEKKTTASKSKAKSATKPAKETKAAEKKAPAKKAATKKTTTKEKTDT